MKKIKIIIVDDHKLFRMTMRMSFSGFPEIEVTGEAGTGEAFFDLLPATPCNLVLLDIVLPGMDGVEIARRLRRDYPGVKILAISSEDSGETIKALLDIGINGFISKQAGSVDEIVNAINSIMNGEVYYGNDISLIMYRIISSKINVEKATPEFTPREKEIIELCGEGLIAKEIADRLGICIQTVYNHKNNIFLKLDINNTAEMLIYALKNKIIG